jgi:hypothetical protein
VPPNTVSISTHNRVDSQLAELADGHLINILIPRGHVGEDMTLLLVLETSTLPSAL